ncbi:MFS general substrate transporter [Ophiobolus disseminans]|uniref:MFS general substrate transporter n=1 Tax=Ophiobolus disseminans TaxID=1469910 RepID=A0A6A6ZP34_9PLEO|nr:MFS general substrate transporter [Ophiobolus disseminans]
MASHTPRGSVEEGAPLLSPPESTTSLDLPIRPQNQTKKQKKPWVLLVVLGIFLVAVIDVGAFLAEPPKTRIFEANICLSYYREHDASAIGADGSIPEQLCKIDAVQQKLAFILGFQDAFDALPGILLAVPFGTLADRVGRKWIFTASLFGLQLGSAWVLLICYFKSLPLQLTWFSSAFFIIGGGPIVASAIAITMMADIVPPDKRTTIFLYLTASVLVAEMIAPIMASKLMEKGDWLPLVLALVIQQLGIFIAFFFPETLHLRDLPEPKDGEDDQSIEMQPKGGHFTLKAQLHNFKTAYTFIRSDWMLGLVIFTFLANRLGRQALTLLVRYASKRYGWKIKDAAYLLSFRAAANLVAVAVFLPLLNWFLLKYLRFPAHWADLWIARGSIILTTVSMLLMGLAAYPALLVFGLLVYNMGTGYNAAMRSVAIHVVGGQASPNVGKLMSTIAIVESIGVMIAGPLLSQMFQWGMDLGSAWLGLPFLGSVLVLAVMTVATFSVSVTDGDVGYVEVRDEDEEEVAQTSALDEERASRHVQPPPIVEPLDPDVARQHAIAAATAAFARAQVHDAADRKAKRSSEVSRSKSNASRKSLTSQGQGSHFPPRESSFRSLHPPTKSSQDIAAQRQSRASTVNTEKFPSFYPAPIMDRPVSAPRPLSAQPSIAFSDHSRPVTQPKIGHRSAASSITSQQIRKARSMYYASSVQTGSPIARPPAKYLTTPPPIAVTSVLEVPAAISLSRPLEPSPVVVPRIPVTVATDESVDKARDKYLQTFQDRSIKHKPSLFMAPFLKRQDKGKDKSKRLSSGFTSVSVSSQRTPNDSTADITLSDFIPQPDKKEKRSFSGSLKDKIKRVFRRTSKTSPNLPVQQIDASRDYFGGDAVDIEIDHSLHGIPGPDENVLQRARQRTPTTSTGDTLTQRAIKRLTVIHEAKDSIGSEADRIASISTKRKSLPAGSLAAFRDPMPMEKLLEESSISVDPKRVFSALMKEIQTSKSTDVTVETLDRTPGAESDVFESSKTKSLHASGSELHSSASRDFRPSTATDQRPPSRRPPSATAQSTQGKASSIRTLGRAIRSTIRTVTPGEHRSSPYPELSINVLGAMRGPGDEAEMSSSSPISEREDCITFNTGFVHQENYRNVFSPSASQIEKRVEKAKDRWKTPLDDSENLHFPRETDRTYSVANVAQRVVSTKSTRTTVEQIEATRNDTHAVHGPPTPSPRPIMSPLSPSVYSRNTDGISILPNDSVMSFNGPNDLERPHNGGSAVILTSGSVRSFVVGTPSLRHPSPHHHPDSPRFSRDWKAWLSHEVSSMEFMSQEDLKIHEQYRFPYIVNTRRSSNNSSRSSRQSKSPSDSIASSLKSSKVTPGPRIYSDLSVPRTHQTSNRLPKQTLKRSDVQHKTKENVTPPLTGTSKSSRIPNISPQGSTPRQKSGQLLASVALNRSTASISQYATNIPEIKHSKHSSSPAATPARIRVRASIRSISPEKLARRPQSAYDLRGARTSLPRPTSELRRPALQLKTSTSSLALNKEPSPGAEDRVIDSILEDGERSGNTTPGQRMADHFLRERKSTGVLESARHRGGMRLVREDTPAFL